MAEAHSLFYRLGNPIWEKANQVMHISLSEDIDFHAGESLLSNIMQDQKTFLAKYSIKNLKIETTFVFTDTITPSWNRWMKSCKWGFGLKLPCACLEYYFERVKTPFQPK